MLEVGKQVTHLAPGLVDRPTERYRDELQIGQQARVVRGRQGASRWFCFGL